MKAAIDTLDKPAFVQLLLQLWVQLNALMPAKTTILL